MEPRDANVRAPTRARNFAPEWSRPGNPINVERETVVLDPAGQESAELLNT